jgi:hypothetical protein
MFKLQESILSDISVKLTSKTFEGNIALEKGPTCGFCASHCGSGCGSSCIHSSMGR